ncbi:MAG: hypothetical protein J07HN6_02517 [Halonotius sp. J07HN6]|nr:MAG: hypothetical protein J07HN6_02517 [Halonotius sp. J07HN6]
MPNTEPIALSGDGITVHKSVRESVYPSPSVVIAVEHWGDEPRTVTITESLPAGVDATLVEFDADTDSHWTARTDELGFTASVADADHIETAYSYAGGFDDQQAWLSPPRVTVTTEDGEETVLSVDDPSPGSGVDGSSPPTVTAVADGGEHSENETASSDADERDTGEATDNGDDSAEHDADGSGVPLTEENIHDYDSGFANISVSPRWSVGLAHEPDNPEAVESGDVYGQGEANPSTDAVDEDPKTLYGEVEPRWSSEDKNSVSSYGEQDAYEPDDDAEESYGYGDSGVVENDDEE